MKFIKSVPLKSGHARVTVDLGKNEMLTSFSENAYYKLSNGMGNGEVVPAHFLYDAEVVRWCPFEQKWI